MFDLLVAAIVGLQPHLPAEVVDRYVHTIMVDSARQRIDPFLVVAQIHRETGGTWNRRLRSRTHDHGLMQIHVTVGNSPMYLGKEYLLYNHRTNIRRGVHLLAFFRQWHIAHCGKNPNHPFWVHYKWGLRKPPRNYSDTVGEIYAQLLMKAFGHSGEV